MDRLLYMAAAEAAEAARDVALALTLPAGQSRVIRLAGAVQLLDLATARVKRHLSGATEPPPPSPPVLAPAPVLAPMEAPEVWKLLSGWPYEVSSRGRVRNVKTKRLRKAVPHKSGYLNVQLYNHGKWRTFLAHRVVAAAFLGAAPSKEHQIAHTDGDRHNNRVENLRWATPQENMQDREAHGRTARGERNGKTKHAAGVVRRVRAMRAKGASLRAISAATGVPVGTVSNYTTGRRRQDGGAK